MRLILLFIFFIFSSICSAQVSIGPNVWSATATNIGIGTVAADGMTVDIAGSFRATEMWGDGSHLSGIAGTSAYQGTTLRQMSFPIFKSAVVSGGSAVFYLTADNTAGGTALFTGGVITESVQPVVSDALASYQMGWTFSNSNKTLTIATNNFTTANILSGLLGQAAANGKTVTVTVWGYA